MIRRSREQDSVVEKIELDINEFEKLKCVHCGGAHLRACPRVKRMVFHNDKSIQEVEFWPEGQWPTENIIWPEDIMEEENAE